MSPPLVLDRTGQFYHFIDSPGLSMTPEDLKNAIMAGADVPAEFLPTPPRSKKSTIEDEFWLEVDDVNAIVSAANSANATTSPLFNKLPGKFDNDFNHDLFGRLIGGVRRGCFAEYLGRDITVTLRERVHGNHPQEIIPFEELYDRARKYLDVEVPDVKLRSRYNSGDGVSFFAGRLAFEGKLNDVPKPTTLKFLEAKFNAEASKSLPPESRGHSAAYKPNEPTIVKKRPSNGRARRQPAVNIPHLVEAPPIRSPRLARRGSGGRVRKLSPKAEEERAAQQAEARAVAAVEADLRAIEASKAFESRSAGSENESVDEMAAPKAVKPRLKIKLTMSPPTSQASTGTNSDAETPAPAPVKAAGKRKREASDDSSPRANKESKRVAFDFNTTHEGVPGRFAQVVKAFLNERSADQDDYLPFDDGRQLAPADGEGSAHYDDEKKLAAAQNFSPDQYKTQKYRFFLAAAMITEQNLRFEQHIAAGRTVKMKSILNLNKTQAQLYNNVDVNKSSKMYDEFKRFGWVPDMIIPGANKTKRVNPVYSTMYPAATRKALLDALKAFEATKYTDSARCVVLPSLT